jgi:hypothetical protein
MGEEEAPSLDGKMIPDETTQAILFGLLPNSQRVSPTAGQP